MSSNRTPFVFKLMFAFCDFASIAIIAISLFCYAFELKDASGYVMDGVVTTVCVVGSVFLFFINQNNKEECIRMHS